jgi:LytS/YehU family sensor histidine kinase
MATTTQAGETTEPPTKQLRGSFDQQERLLVPLEEELAVVRAYLDIESLRLGDRLRVEQTIDPGLSKVLMPPFSFQPLVENAVQHGLYSSARAGRLQLVVRPKGEWLEMSVSDDGGWLFAQLRRSPADSFLVLSPRKRVRQDDCKSRKSSGKWQRDEGLAPDVMDLAKWCFGFGMRFHN